MSTAARRSKTTRHRPPPARPSSVAVVVAHGMGQQVPFETLELMARGLIDVAGQEGQHTLDYSKPRAETVLLGKQRLQRVRLQGVDAGGDQVELHLYEGYWAPITEGRVGIGDVLTFLFSAGWNGLRNRKTFNRWIFGSRVSWPVPRSTPIAILTALCFTISLVLMHLLVSAAFTFHLSGIELVEGWPSKTLLARITWSILGYSAFALLFGLALWLVARARGRLKRAERRRLWQTLNGMLTFLFHLWVGVVTPLTAALLVALVIWDYLFPPAGSGDQLLGLLAAWALLLAISWKVRNLLIQYVGDVAAYVASHRLDRFMEVRTRIREWVGDVVGAVYDAAHEDGGPLYDRVALVGHSLGSVILYDVLNGLLNSDHLAGEGAPEARYRGVIERTRLFLTFGSPLDKTAFVFRHQKSQTGEIRERLAAAVQPLIQSYPLFRRFPWINVYAPRDIFAGPLDFYDDENAEGYTEEMSVQNQLDEDALIPLLAHTEYWENPTIFIYLYRALLGEPPNAPGAQRSGVRSSPRIRRRPAEPGRYA